MSKHYYDNAMALLPRHQCMLCGRRFNGSHCDFCEPPLIVQAKFDSMSHQEAKDWLLKDMGLM